MAIRLPPIPVRPPGPVRPPRLPPVAPPFSFDSGYSVHRPHSFMDLFPNTGGGGRTRQGVNDQEYDFIDQFYNGDLAGDLAGTRNALGLDLAGLRDRDRASSGALIGDYEHNLGHNRSEYLARAQAEIDREAHDQTAELSDIEKAERSGMDQAILEGDRSSRAAFAAKGAGPSSYASRLAIGLRSKAASDLSQKLAAVRMANRKALEDQRRSLNAGLSDRERADLGAVYGDRSALNSRLLGDERGDTRDMFSLGRDDQRFLLDRGTSFLGKRTPLLPRDSTNFFSRRGVFLGASPPRL